MIRQEIPPVPTFLLAKNVIYGHLGAIQSPYTSLADRPRIGTIGNHQIQGSLFDCSFLFTESDAFLKNYIIVHSNSKEFSACPGIVIYFFSSYVIL